MSNERYKGQSTVLEGSPSGAYPYITKLDYNCQGMVKYIGECKSGRLDDERGHYIERYDYDCKMNVSSIKIAQNFLYIYGTNISIVVSPRFITLSITGGDFEELNDDDSLYFDTGTQSINNAPIKKIDTTTIRIYKDVNANGTLDSIVNEVAALTTTNCYAELKHESTKPYEKRKWSLRDRYFYA